MAEIKVPIQVNLPDDWIGQIVNRLRNDPDAEWVEIVRCKDCKHRDPEDKKCDCGHDILWQLPRQDDWYCADAERRTDEPDK